MKKLIAGNWKMNGSVQGAHALVQAVSAGLWSNSAVLEVCDFAVFPPFVHIPDVVKTIRENGQPVIVGAQDCSIFDNGAYTGDVSVEMLVEVGCRYVLLGHSERRQYYQESDAQVAAKAAKAHAGGMITILCVGETEEEREKGRAQDIVSSQLSGSLPESATFENTAIAYEPVWAIGTGKTATPEDVGEMHSFIREKLKERVADFEKMRILYGGSMKPENAKELLATPNVDGGLIGGASLDAEKFLAIGNAAV